MDIEPIYLIVSFIGFFLALTVHEFSHALSAYYLGDTTAMREGRLTLNPIAHIDLFGTIILPLMLILSSTGVVFGWAKPVPVNYYALRNAKWGPALVSLAGPAANFVFGVISVMILLLVYRYSGLEPSNLVYEFLYMLAMINFVLMFFNLIPIPPLDGSKILYAILPVSMNNIKSILDQYGLIILIALLIMGLNFIFVWSSWLFRIFYELFSLIILY